MTIFKATNKNEWGDKQHEVSKALCKYLSKGESFEVKFQLFKTPKQLKAYWRLIDLITPFMMDIYGEIEDRKDVSCFVKHQVGYYNIIPSKLGDVVKYKSLQNANKEDLSLLIDRLLFMCDHFNIKNYELSSEEKSLIT